MVLTYKTENVIKFPVFPLPTSNWSRSDNLLIVDDKVVDDLNQIGESLGVRRIQTPIKELYPLKRKADDLISILKCKQDSFIDSNGIPFIYEKTLWVPLKYLKISRIVKKVNCSVLYANNCNVPFTIPRPPEASMEYAGVLFLYNLPWRLYAYSEKALKATRRKV